MRRWWTALAVGSAAALVLAGCGTPTGVDGDLTDEWPTLPVPRVFVPTEGACHAGVQDVGYLSGWNPVDCAGTHHTETMHVGTLTGASGRSAAPPQPARPPSGPPAPNATARYAGRSARTGGPAGSA